MSKEYQNIKADDGTEHTLIEPVHIALRMINDHEDNALNSFSIITSPQNQRIEAYWLIWFELVGGGVSFKIWQI